MVVVLSAHSSEEEEFLKEFLISVIFNFKGRFCPMRFSSLPRLHGSINIVVKGDLCLSFQGLNKSFGISCTKLGLRAGVRALIYLSTMVIYLGYIIIFHVLMFYGLT